MTKHAIEEDILIEWIFNELLSKTVARLDNGLNSIVILFIDDIFGILLIG